MIECIHISINTRFMIRVLVSKIKSKLIPKNHIVTCYPGYKMFSTLVYIRIVIYVFPDYLLEQ